MPAKLAKRQEPTGSGPISYRMIGQPASPIGLFFEIDYTDAPVPEHFYVADYVYVANLDSDVLLVFGKGERPEMPQEKLRSKVEVFFPAPVFVNQFWKSCRDFYVVLRKAVEAQRYQVHEVPSSDVYTEKVQTLHSNNALIVLSGGESMIDFFYMSPRDVFLKPRRNQEIRLEALVRILLAPPLLLSLLNACAPIAETLKGRFPMEEIGNESMESD